MPKIDPVPQTVAVASIRPSHHRALDPGVVRQLADSIRLIGVLNPIAVLRRDADPGEPTFQVVAGDHRLAAAAAAGLKVVPVHVLDLSSAEAQIATIDENLYRHNLSPAEETAAIAQRKVLWDALHSAGGARTETAPAGQDEAPGEHAVTPGDGSNPAAAAHQAKPGTGGRGHKSFATETAEIMGIAPRTSHRITKRAEVLGPDAGQLAGTSLDRAGELDALVETDAATRADLVQRAIAGEQVSAKAALPKPAKPEVAAVAERTPEDYVDALMQALRACAAHVAIDAIAKYRITAKLGRAERELIRSLASEPAMADVGSGLFEPAAAAAGTATTTPAPDSPSADPATPASVPAVRPVVTHAVGAGRWHPAPDAPDLLDDAEAA